MGCERFEENLIDLALGAPPAPALAEHLGACPACRAELQRLERLSTAIDSTLESELRIEAPSDLAARASGRPRAEPPRARPWVPLAAAAAAALALALGALLTRGKVEPPHAPAPEVRVEPKPAPSGAPAAARREPPRETARRRTRRPGPGPEILVPPGQERAILLLSARLWEAGLDDSSVLASPPDPRVDLPVPADLNVAPIDLKPLALADLEPDRSER